MEIINIRRSVRSYLDKPVEKEKVELLLRAAMQAPSARNQQPWHFVVVDDPETLRAIATVSRNMQMLNEAPLAILVLIDKENLTAPLMAPQDAAAATQNILLKAVDLGLGTCWCGVHPRIERAEPLARILNVPDRYEIFSLIAVGYPKDQNANRFVNRFNPERIHYNKF
ncbi:MAG TPA: nitroreductase family protein [Acholeplasmataceae bacterium]|jgi:nitroreductase|nr:nitroreductase family protein [Acholeplasmataceae bacterium]